MDQEPKQQLRREELVQGQLTKVVYQEGQGQKPVKGQEVHALYRGTLENGSEFDSNLNPDSPFKFTLGQGMVIKGWDEGFASMKRGEKAKLICSPEYGYGARGSPPKIPGNSTLHFEVELLDFEDKKKQKWDMDTKEKVEEAGKFKQEGNAFLKDGKFKEAIKKYNEGIDFVDAQDDEEAKNLLKALRMNVSQAYLKTKEYSKTIQNCTKVLQNDPNNIKTLYRRAVAYHGNQDFDLAKGDANKILELDPNSEEAKQELAKIVASQKAAIAKEKKVFGGMFSKSGLYDDKKPKQKKNPQPEEKDDTDSEGDMPDLEKEEEVAEKKEEGEEQMKQ